MAETRNPVGQLRGQPQPEAPSVWVLEDDRPGNSTQSVGLAEALGWPFRSLRLRFGWCSRLHNRWLGASRAGVRAHEQGALKPPWPDLVIAAGRRTAPVALWIRKQSGGRTRLVQLGRKGADVAELFDLSVTPRYTRQLPHARRIETTGPLHRIEEAKLATEAEAWAPELVENASGPRMVLLVGGISGQYRIDLQTAREMGEAVAELARGLGASLYVSVSRRTPAPVADALEAALGEVQYFYRWSPGDARNPYLAYLALGDFFVITGDSESMLVEACSRSKPVWIYPLSVRKSFRWLRFNREWVVRWAVAARRRQSRTGSLGMGALCAYLVEQGYVRPARNLDRLHFDLIERGRALPFGARAPLGIPAAAEEDREKVARAVKEMLQRGSAVSAALPHLEASVSEEEQAQPAPELSLYMTSWCSFCARVVAAIDELGLAVELRDIDASASFRDELQAATGGTTVPCLRMASQAGEVSWLHESRDIIEALHGFAGR